MSTPADEFQDIKEYIKDRLKELYVDIYIDTEEYGKWTGNQPNGKIMELTFRNDDGVYDDEVSPLNDDAPEWLEHNFGEDFYVDISVHTTDKSGPDTAIGVEVYYEPPLRIPKSAKEFRLHAQAGQFAIPWVGYEGHPEYDEIASIASQVLDYTDFSDVSPSDLEKLKNDVYTDIGIRGTPVFNPKQFYVAMTESNSYSTNIFPVYLEMKALQNSTIGAPNVHTSAGYSTNYKFRKKYNIDTEEPGSPVAKSTEDLKRYWQVLLNLAKYGQETVPSVPSYAKEFVLSATPKHRKKWIIPVVAGVIALTLFGLRPRFLDR